MWSCASLKCDQHQLYLIQVSGMLASETQLFKLLTWMHWLNLESFWPMPTLLLSALRKIPTPPSDSSAYQLTASHIPSRSRGSFLSGRYSYKSAMQVQCMISLWKLSLRPLCNLFGFLLLHLTAWSHPGQHTSMSGSGLHYPTWLPATAGLWDPCLWKVSSSPQEILLSNGPQDWPLPSALQVAFGLLPRWVHSYLPWLRHLQRWFLWGGWVLQPHHSQRWMVWLASWHRGWLWCQRQALPGPHPVLCGTDPGQL